MYGCAGVASISSPPPLYAPPPVPVATSSAPLRPPVVGAVYFEYAVPVCLQLATSSRAMLIVVAFLLLWPSESFRVCGINLP